MNEEVKKIIEEYFLDVPVNLIINELTLNKPMFSNGYVVITKSNYPHMSKYNIERSYMYEEREIRKIVAKQMYLFSYKINDSILDFHYNNMTDTIEFEETVSDCKKEKILEIVENTVKEIIKNGKGHYITILKDIKDVKSFSLEKNKNTISLIFVMNNTTYSLTTETK